MDVHPILFEVQLRRAMSSRVEFFYMPVFDYNTGSGERDSRNLGSARPDADVVDQELSIVFEPGEHRCVIRVDITDDFIVEDQESFKVEFSRRVGALVNYSSTDIVIDIGDDEPVPVIEPVDMYLSEGESVAIPVTIPVALDHDLRINVSIGQDSTTAAAEEYEFLPSAGVVTIQAGQTEAAYSVSILGTEELDGDSLDNRIYIETDLDGILDIEPSKVTVNRWPFDESELGLSVLEGAVGTQAIDLEVGSTGLVYVLNSGLSATQESELLVSAFSPGGGAYPLIGSGGVRISMAGVNITPKAIAVKDDVELTTLAIVFEVDAKFADVYRGGKDFVVAYYQKIGTDDFVALESYQYGSELDDVVVGAEFGAAGELLIYGRTSGQEFDGIPRFEGNYGGIDGFVYKFASQIASPSWVRFIGSIADDKVVGLDSSRSELVVLTEVDDSDAFIRAIDTTSSLGEDVEGLDDVTINTDFVDNYTGVKLDDSAQNYYVYGSSRAQLPNNELGASLSDDLYFLIYDVEGVHVTSIKLGTPGEDVSSAFNLLPNRGRVAIGGMTDGVFGGQQKIGATGADVFVSILDIEDSRRAEILSTTQFGTPGNDELIDIEAVAEDKFMVLWSEDYTSGDGTVTYRISPFGPDGRKLVDNPL